MKLDLSRVFTRQHITSISAFTLILLIASAASATMLSPGDGNERQGYSDMPFPTILNLVGGSNYDATTDVFQLTSFSTQLELGDEFGPLNPGIHYGLDGGLPGTLGGLFSARLDITGVTIDDTGAVTNGGSVDIILNSTTAGSVGDDYSILVGDSLLEGFVSEVLISSGGGGNVLDVLFTITGGALQSLTNPDLPGVPFAPNNYGLFHFVGGGIPADWTSNFDLTGGAATLNTFGIPEPGSLVLTMLAATLALTGRKK